ncbi:MAG: hypothetical protein DMH00_07050 [Acidobacteria bacterium]|nr:MAG: hypothetical protein DMH00_07050 [Acidobacteriota bacterium]
MSLQKTVPEASCPAAFACRLPLRFGAGFRLRRLAVLAGWLLVPSLLVAGAQAHSPLHFLTAAILVAALWPVTTRSGEVLWDGPRVLVRRYFRFVLLSPDQVEAAVVTPPSFRRQSLVLKLRRPLHLSRYVYCRLAPGTVCDAWALVHDRDWEPRGSHEPSRV